MSGFLSNLGAHFGIGGSGASKPPAWDAQWAQLGNYFPNDKTGTKTDDKGQHVDVADILSALQGLTGGGQAPPAQQPMQFDPMPQSRFLPGLQNAPQLGQRQMTGPPPQMAPYLWVGR